jgi:hypothetical protein
VNRPPFTPGFVLEMFWTHRRISSAAENPKWNENTPSKSRTGFGRLRPPDRASRKRCTAIAAVWPNPEPGATT